MLLIKKKRKECSMHRNSSKSPTMFCATLSPEPSCLKTLLFFSTRSQLSRHFYSISRMYVVLQHSLFLSPVCSNITTLFFALSPVCSRSALVFPFSETKFLYVVHTQTIIPVYICCCVPEIF